MPYLGSQYLFEKTHGADVIPMGGTGTDKSCDSIETGHGGGTGTLGALICEHGWAQLKSSSRTIELGIS